MPARSGRPFLQRRSPAAAPSSSSNRLTGAMSVMQGEQRPQTQARTERERERATVMVPEDSTARTSAHESDDVSLGQQQRRDLRPEQRRQTHRQTQGGGGQSRETGRGRLPLSVAVAQHDGHLRVARGDGHAAALLLAA